MLSIKEEVAMDSVIKLKNSKLGAAKSLMVAARLQEETDPEFAAVLYRKAAISMWGLVSSREQQISFLRDEILELRNMKSDSVTSASSDKSIFSGIFLDFEGTGKSPMTNVIPEPHMAGVYRRGPRNNIEGYRAYCFRPDWKPISNGLGAFVSLISLDDFLQMLVDEAESTNQKIFYWSDHEKKVVDSLGSERLSYMFNDVSTNLLPIARSHINRLQLDLPSHDKKTLNQYLSILAPHSEQVITPSVGPAESCKRLDKYCSKHARWSRWTDKQKATAKDLFDYNKQDCMALMRLTRKLITRVGSQHKSKFLVVQKS
jgi:hypothetical protein